MTNRITQLFNIQYPIIQAGMIWTSGWRLAAAVSNAGGLGIIGAGSMYPHVLEDHLQKMNDACKKPYGVNVPMLYPDIDKLMEIIVAHKVPVVFTSAGNPKTWTEHLKKHGITVVHVIASVKFAKKCEEVGVDAIVAEGFEAGGHNGREETTTLCLIPMVRDAVSLPLMAAGGIAGGRAMMASFALGAEGVQVGSRFAASIEASCHDIFKHAIVSAKEGDTMLSLKKLTPVRLIKNKFFQQVAEAEARGANEEELALLLGRARAKKGMFEGNLDEGELEIGQVAAQINEVLPAATILQNIWDEFVLCQKQLAQMQL